MKDDITFISNSDIIKLLAGKFPEILILLENAFKSIDTNRVIFPDKYSLLLDDKSKNRINIMPAVLLDHGIGGCKYVTVTPSNNHLSHKNVNGVIILSDNKNGEILAVLDGSLLTSIRTSVVGSIAAKYLSPHIVQKISFIGCGVESKQHLINLLQQYKTISEVSIMSRSQSSELEFMDLITNINPNINVDICHNDCKRLCEDSDIIISAISSQCEILNYEYISKGGLYIHVGGVEDNPNVALNSDKIVCDNWESCKHREQTISLLYKQNRLKDSDIYADLKSIIMNDIPGRSNDSEFIYFNSVGLSVLDVTLAYYVYLLHKETKNQNNTYILY